jgi:gliding motility associated protien GldN
MKALLILAAIAILPCLPASAQPAKTGGVIDPPSDFPWSKADSRSKSRYSYVHVREADVAWSKRVWRTIDLREKMNQPLYYPLTPTEQRRSLWDVIKDGMASGNLTIYDNPLFDDEFRIPLREEAAMAKIVKIDSFPSIDINGNPITIVDTVELMSEDIKQYWVKEDWFFDKQRGVMDARIIGICPIKESKDASGNVRGYQPLFWIYFPELRYHIANAETYTRSNNAERMTYDEIFSKRFFGSYIHKESNVYNRSIAEYKTGLDALLEAERVKEGTFMMEHDMWHF